MDKKIKELKDTLESKGIECKYFKTKEEAKNEILNNIDSNMSIGIGGSMTITELDIYEDILSMNKNVYWHWKVRPEDRDKVRRKASFATDLYLTSTNAITESGELVNIDGVGNRVSAMYYGPKRVIVVCGINKICTSYTEAITRIKTIACPQNARRLGLETPCAVEGTCKDCNVEERMCNVTTIINRKPMNIDLNIYIVDEELGF